MLCLFYYLLIDIKENGNFQYCGEIESNRRFEFYAEKIIANAGSFALAIILFFGIYEVTVIFGFT